MVNPSKLHEFFEELVRELRDRGVVCGITSGLACVHYGIAETTKDCDLLCHGASFPTLLQLLNETKVEGINCQYRGNISPPLDERWHKGGWTSHFEWSTTPQAVVLDVFGKALRQSSPWEREILGLYASPHIVAQMKRTNRDKDWPFITALGVRMLEAEDERGWLHIYELDMLQKYLATKSCPPELMQQRPALRFALANDPRASGALNAERRLWEELDRQRIKLLEKYLRPYVSAVRRARGKELSLAEDHEIRVKQALDHLPMNPLKDYGIPRYIKECQENLVTSGVIPEQALTWLPNLGIYFEWLNQ